MNVNVGADSDGSTTSSKGRLNVIHPPKATDPAKASERSNSPEAAVAQPGTANHDYAQANTLSARAEEAKAVEVAPTEERSILPKDWVMFMGTLTSLFLIVACVVTAG